MYFSMFITLSMMSVVAGAYDFIDLTHNLGPDPPSWPGTHYKLFSTRGYTKYGYWFEINRLETPVHISTHVDAPGQFGRGKYRAHQIPLNDLVGPGVIVNVTKKATENPDYRVTIEDLKAWENEYGQIPVGSIVLMKSGWSSKYPNKKLVFGTDNPNYSKTFHYPSWGLGAAEWLISKRSVKMLGVDSPSNDYGQTHLFPVHQAMSKAQMSGVENVANLESIPESGCTIYVGAVKLFEGSGAHARVFATCSTDDKPTVSMNKEK